MEIRALWSKVEVQAGVELLRKYRDDLGFMPSAVLEAAASRGEVLGGWEKGRLVGLACWHLRLDEDLTLHQLLVDEPCRGRGIDKRLLEEVRRRASRKIRARVPKQTGAGFYEQMGFSVAGEERGKRRRLLVLERDCSGVGVYVSYNVPMARAVLRAGGMVGASVDKTRWDMERAGIPISFMDIAQWASPDWDQWRDALIEVHPELIVVPDIMSEGQVRRALEAASLAEWEGAVPILVPKVDVELPEGHRLGYSVPTSHGGTELPFSYFAGREVHLLGGSPIAQARYAADLASVGGKVVSLDTNYLGVCMKYGEGIGADLERRKGIGMEESLRNIVAYWKQEVKAEKVERGEWVGKVHASPAEEAVLDALLEGGRWRALELSKRAGCTEGGAVVAIGRLRRKMEGLEVGIKTAHGSGYFLAPKGL